MAAAAASRICVWNRIADGVFAPSPTTPPRHSRAPHPGCRNGLGSPYDALFLGRQLDAGVGLLHLRLQPPALAGRKIPSSGCKMEFPNDGEGPLEGAVLRRNKARKNTAPAASGSSGIPVVLAAQEPHFRTIGGKRLHASGIPLKWQSLQ